MVTYGAIESGSSLQGGPQLADLAQSLRRASVRLNLAVDRLTGEGHSADEGAKEVLREVNEYVGALADEVEGLAQMGHAMIRLLPSVYDRLVKHVTPIPQRMPPAVAALADGPMTTGIIAAVFANVAVAQAVRSGLQATEACNEWGPLVGDPLGDGRLDGLPSEPGQPVEAHALLLRRLLSDLALQPVTFLRALFDELQQLTPDAEPAAAC